ncbi:hypothetical protein OG216_44610 [Streptomycetaceae bacterium NBC_01309]
MDDVLWDSWPEPWVGTQYDVRTVMAAMSQKTKDEFRYGAIPWERIPHYGDPGDDIPVLLARLASDDAEAARQALSRLSRALRLEGRSADVAAWAVPFLLRITAIGKHRGLRAEVLRLTAEIGRTLSLGGGSRAELLAVAEGPMVISGSTMCPVDWTIQAAREAVTVDCELLLPLLADLDAAVRAAAAFTLAVASGEAARIAAALHRRWAVEDDPSVQISLILAIAQLAREHPDDNTAADWVRDLWSDLGQPPHVRVGAGLAWLCLVEGPVPDGLRTLLADPETEQLGDLFQKSPWFPPVDYKCGLLRCVHEMLIPDVR